MEPPVEYAALGHRHAGIAYRSEINAVQRQRLLALQDLASTGAPMHSWERRELLLLARLQGERGPELDSAELAELARLQQETTLQQLGVIRSHSGSGYETRASGRQRLLEMLAPRPLSGRQALCTLEEQRIFGEITSWRQLAVWRARSSA